MINLARRVGGADPAVTFQRFQHLCHRRMTEMSAPGAHSPEPTRACGLSLLGWGLQFDYVLTQIQGRYLPGPCRFGRPGVSVATSATEERRISGSTRPGYNPSQGSPENRACKTGKGRESTRRKMSDKGTLSAILYVLPQIRRYRGRPGNHLVGTMPSIKFSGLRSSRRPIRHGRNYGPLGIAT